MYIYIHKYLHILHIYTLPAVQVPWGMVKPLLLHIILRCPLTESSYLLKHQTQVSWAILWKCFSELWLHPGSQMRAKPFLDRNVFLQENVSLHTCHKVPLNMVLVSSSYLEDWYASFLSWRKKFLEAEHLSTFVFKRPLTFYLHRTRSFRSRVVCVNSWEVESQECQAG